MQTRALPRSRYLDRPYRIVITREGRGNSAGWKAAVEEWPGCEARGATVDEAALAIRDAMDAWVSDALANGRRIPPPQGAVTQNGPIELDIPPSLYAALTKGAVREGLELKAFINTALAAAVGWRPTETEPDAIWLGRRAERFAESGQDASQRWLRFTALTSTVLSVLAVLAALVLLYVALKHA